MSQGSADFPAVCSVVSQRVFCDCAVLNVVHNVDCPHWVRRVPEWFFPVPLGPPLLSGASMALEADLEFKGEASLSLVTRIDLRQTQFLKMWEEKFGDGSSAASGDALEMADDGPSEQQSAAGSGAGASGASGAQGDIASLASSSTKSDTIMSASSGDTEGDEAAVSALLAASGLEEGEEAGGSGGAGGMTGGGAGGKGGGSGGKEGSVRGGKGRWLMDRVKGAVKNMAASLNQVTWLAS